MKPLPMLLDSPTALLLRLHQKRQRRWPLDWPEQHVMPFAQEAREPARAEHGSAGEPTGRWGWRDPEGTFYPAPVPGPGAVLYVREAFAYLEPKVAGVASRLGMEPVKNLGTGEWAVARSSVAARTVGGPAKGEPLAIGNTTIERWASAIHMPTWAATQYVEVGALFLHRLQGITHDEVVAEGITGIGDEAATMAAWPAFWDAMNPGAKWETDPMVAAVRFRPLTQEEVQRVREVRAEGGSPAQPRGGRRRGRARKGAEAAQAAGAEDAGGGAERPVDGDPSGAEREDGGGA